MVVCAAGFGLFSSIAAYFHTGPSATKFFCLAFPFAIVWGALQLVYPRFGRGGGGDGGCSYIEPSK